MGNAESHAIQHGPRAVALIGPYGSGKTTLFEALMTASGTPLRRAGEAKSHIPSTETRLTHCSFLGDPWAMLDCPGSVEFAYETASALAVADLAVVVAEPDPSRALALRSIFRMVEAAEVPFIVFVNKIDTLKVPLKDLLAALQAEADRPLVLRQMPIGEGGAITGYVDLVSERAYRYRPDTASELIRMPDDIAGTGQAAHEALIDTLADRDDALLEKVIEGAIPTPAELYEHLQKDVAERSLAGVMLGAADHANGVMRLWKALRHDTPDPAATALRRGIAPDGPPLAQVFKTTYAGQAGKLAYARVWRGKLRDGASFDGVRIGGILRNPGNDTQKITEAKTGDLVGLGRLDGVATGAALGESPESLRFPAPPPAVHAIAIAAADRKDDVKLSGALQKLLEEDPSFSLIRDPETGEMLLTGQGEIHLNRAIDRLAKVWGLAVGTARPRVRFKETIRKPVHQHARLKRQTGGHGQFADVKLDIAPRARGEGFLFIDRIVGGAVPRQYIPAVGDAAEQATRKGPFGYPVVDIGVTLVDGGFHSVDSSDMAFRSATRAGMAEALAKADPVLLEPIHRVTVSAPNMFTANVQRLLTGRRGQILGYSEKPGWSGWDDTEALVPEAELHGMIIELRSQTAGLGGFVHQFDHLAEAPARLAEKIARDAAAQ
ncbi:elongation factor G [Acidiphilium sp. AL]|uniref:Elongation factor G n=1 Tax=Acidiphilium iwatense TaxID=768198 RepID=A0ABS9DTN7_9PROT|nr:MULTISPECIES: elongation factor G [Acidiphilium]MCF3945145.1 elongation factor G [Acidiphilium iwatense]MCU4160182.1 elongation factor G [Acidiphilium sp. AL]